MSAEINSAIYELNFSSAPSACKGYTLHCQEIKLSSLDLKKKRMKKSLAVEHMAFKGSMIFKPAESYE